MTSTRSRKSSIFPWTRRVWRDANATWKIPMETDCGSRLGASERDRPRTLALDRDASEHQDPGPLLLPRVRAGLDRPHRAGRGAGMVRGARSSDGRAADEPAPLEVERRFRRALRRHGAVRA